jgi:hypothetical protein
MAALSKAIFRTAKNSPMELSPGPMAMSIGEIFAMTVLTVNF